MAWNDDRYKIYSKDRGETFELYDLETDPSESKDIASEKPEIVQSMKEGLNEWLKSLKKSDRGMDY
jgi:hypothetical protein